MLKNNLTQSLQGNEANQTNLIELGVQNEV
jgi:hypothetical protein